MKIWINVFGVILKTLIFVFSVKILSITLLMVTVVTVNTVKVAKLILLLAVIQAITSMTSFKILVQNKIAKTAALILMQTVKDALITKLVSMATKLRTEAAVRLSIQDVLVVTLKESV